MCLSRQGKECSPPPQTQFFSFRVRTGDHNVAEWGAVHVGGCLYIHVPDENMPPGSKEWYVVLTIITTTSLFFLECCNNSNSNICIEC